MTNLVTSCVAALGLAVLFERLHVPAGAMLGAMVGVALHNVFIKTAPSIPDGLTFLSYVVLGWVVGQAFTRATLSALRESLVPMALILGALLVSTALISVVVRRLGLLDNVTAFLAASPGALTQMAAVSQATGGDTVFIVTIHTLRVVAVLVIAPIVAKLLD